MRALVFEGIGHISYRPDHPEPHIEEPTDAIVAVSLAGLCGSDLHPYEGREPARPGVVPGHEAVGEVMAVGTDVTEVEVGDRVIAAFTTSCGACSNCRRGVTARCERGQLFGWGEPDSLGAVPASAAAESQLDGGQAEQLRVPLADSTLTVLPASIDDPTALLLTDNLPTAWEAVLRSDLRSGEALVIVGLGSVGLCAVAAGIALGAGPILGIDPVLDRRERALALGAMTTTTPQQALQTLADPTQAASSSDLSQWLSDGSLSVVDAAGTDAAQRLAFELLRPGGTLSLIAVQTGSHFPFSPVEAYDRNVTVRAGRASVRHTLQTLLPRLLDGQLASPADHIVTHRDVPLASGAELYRRFAARESGLVKASFAPRAG